MKKNIMLFFINFWLIASSASPLALAATAPLPPTNLTLKSVTSSSAAIAWKASPSANITNYLIYRNDAQVASVLGNVLTYTNTGLTASKKYNYKVKAKNSSGKLSVASNVLSVTTASSKVINGSCGSANGVGVTSAPTTNFCSTGTATSVSGNGPWSWSCDGSNGGSNASCSSPVLPPAACGSTPSGSTVTQTVSTTPGSIAATTSQCPYGGTEPTVTTVTQTYLCTNGTLSAQGSPVSTITDTGSPTCNLAPVNGSCGTANGVESASAPAANLCSSGNASSVSETGTTLWNWNCSGSNGGTNASCSAPVQPTAVNGTCGSANGVTATSAPTSNLCGTGTATSVSGTGPWSWSCTGLNGGSTASCSAPLTAVLAINMDSLTTSMADVQPGQTISFSATLAANQTVSSYPLEFSVIPTGTTTNTAQTVFFVNYQANTPLTQTYSWTVPTGTASGPYSIIVAQFNPSWSAILASATTPFTIGTSAVNGTCGSSNSADFTNVPTTNLCNTGNASSVTGSGPFNWSCAGVNGGTSASCSALLAVNGTCGSSNSATLSSAPSSNLCASGTASVISGAGPWTWVCVGINQGSNASCSASPTFTNGACGTANEIATSSVPTTNSLCSAGYSLDMTGSGPWNWNCVSSNGGSTASCMAPLAVSGTPTAEQPGPSAALLADPTYGEGIGTVYTCVNNYYVSPTGNDSNPGTQASPWLTIQHADSSARQGGDCINVAPGTYTWNYSFIQTHGGTQASPTGYVTYRCESLDACHIVYNGSPANPVWELQGATYVVVDGFDVDGGDASTYGGLANTCFGSMQMNPWWVAGHHIWVLNNKIHGCNLGGVGYQSTEYMNTIHNEVYDNAWTSGYQGSGIGYVVMQPLGSSAMGETYAPNIFPVYTPTAQDNGYAPFHNLVLWNKVHENGCTTCLGSTLELTTTADTNSNTTLSGLASTSGLAVNELVFGPGIQPLTYVQSFSGSSVTLTRPATTTAIGGTYQFSALAGGHTDGNGIIMDTWDGGVGGNVNTYPYQTLVAFNDSENNGGRGIHIFATNNVTVANNSTYNNGLDATQTGLTELSQAGGQYNNWYNNTAKAVISTNYTLEAGDSRGVTDLNNTFKDNVVIGGLGVGLWNNDQVYWTTTNDQNQVTDPLYVDPVDGNLNLQSTSPAVGYFYAQPYLPASTSDSGAYQNSDG